MLKMLDKLDRAHLLYGRHHCSQDLHEDDTSTDQLGILMPVCWRARHFAVHKVLVPSASYLFSHVLQAEQVHGLPHHSCPALQRCT